MIKERDTAFSRGRMGGNTTDNGKTVNKAALDISRQKKARFGRASGRTAASLVGSTELRV